MSLLLLFNPSPGGVNPQSAFTPAVVNEIQIARPTLMSVQQATGQFTESTVQYSSSTVEYSSSTETYGGSDASKVVIKGGSLDSIDSATPKIYSIEKI